MGQGIVSGSPPKKIAQTQYKANMKVFVTDGWDYSVTGDPSVAPVV